MGYRIGLFACSAVVVQCRLVTDGQTHDDNIYRTIIAACGNNTQVTYANKKIIHCGVLVLALLCLKSRGKDDF